MHSDYVTVLKIEIQIKSKQIIRLYQIVFDNYANYKCTKASFHRCLYILSLDQKWEWGQNDGNSSYLYRFGSMFMHTLYADTAYINLHRSK